jgi:hypothetical protein
VKLDAFAIADHSLLIGTPALAAGAMLWATLTPGNPIEGLLIGWAAVSAWSAIGGRAVWLRYWKR